jgi:hypothetical protein
VFETLDRKNRLTIAGLKEGVVWIKDDQNDKPIGWMAGIGIAGLIPDPFKGYKFRYTVELISTDGQIVSTGILSQAPGYMGMSTTVAIGGKGLPADNYTVCIRGDNGEEDTMIVTVPDYGTWLAQVKQEDNQIDDQNELEDLSPKPEMTRNKINNKLKFVNKVYLEENCDSILLIVERKDQTKRSVVLREPTEALDISHVLIDDATISIIKKSLTIWGKKVSAFADKHIEDQRQEIEFFNDIVTLSRCLASLPDELSRILKPGYLGAATDLLHNRIMVQIMHEYHTLGFQITLPPRKNAGRKMHDFNVLGYNSEYRCEVKTIQRFGELERTPLGGYRLTEKSHESFISGIRDDFEDAMKVGENSITIIAPCSYRINALLRKYFDKQLLPLPPIPSPNTTVLVVTSNHVFQDGYISFPSDRAPSILENSLSNIQIYGISPLVLIPIREGLTISMTTAPKAGSSVGYSF